MPETTVYLNLGLVVVVITLGLYVLSLVLRFRQSEKNGEASQSQHDE
jgi:hypothetical protein